MAGKNGRLYYNQLLMSKKVFLITGGAGFIGSSLGDALLAAGHQVINIDNFNDFYDPQIKQQNIAGALDNANYTLYQEDIRDTRALADIFANHQIDVVVHLAAMAGVRPSIDQPTLYEEVNVQGTLNIMNSMQAYGVKKLVYASSSSIYGNRVEVPFREDNPLGRVISPYAATKKSAEDFCYVYHHLFDLDVVALRFFTVYGPRQRPDLAIHKFTRMIINEEPVPFFGDGSTMRDYAYIDDVVQGVVAAIDYVAGNEQVFAVFNLSGNKPVSLQEMVACLEEAIGRKAIINRLPMQPGDVVLTQADIAKARKMLGFQPNFSFTEGIARFIAWYKSSNP